MAFKKSALEPRWLLVFSFFLAGIFLGGLSAYLWIGGSSPLAVKLHPVQRKFKYINPLLAVDISNSPQFAQDASLVLQLHGTIDPEKQRGKIGDAQVYFQDLETGVWAGINDTASYRPGRLLRLPIMIAYYKIAMADPTVLGQTLVFHGPDQNKTELIPPGRRLEVGGAYSIDELVQRMIVDADDNAAKLLFDNIDKKFLNEIFSDLGISFNESEQPSSVISLKLSSLFYRVLYNATYLNEEYSERALDLLVIADNSIGLGAYLPKGVGFANRYNTIAARGADNLPRYDMADCGIVYYPGHPYLICARAAGAQSLDGAESLLAKIGNVVYADISYRFPRSL